MHIVKSAFVAAGFGLLLIAASCANPGTEPGTDAGSDAPPIGPCGPGTAVKCGDTCVDTQSNSQNCGACGKACDSSLVCSHGTCATVCAAGTIHCGNDCIDQGSDVNNCGGCGKACPPGNVCSKGSCELTCQDALTNCNGDCVDVTQSDDNCGACGSPCPGGTVCQDSKCVATCQTGWTSCGVGDAGATTCVDTQHDPQNCGGCNTKCPNGQFCSPVNNVGTCGIQCFGGTSLCGSACVDESIDKNHCGNCNTVCSGVCSAGHCCSSGQVYCGACDTPLNCTVKSGGALAAGLSHTCGINSSGVLKCWGEGSDGELGNGKGTLSKVPVLPSISGTAIFVGAGGSHTCAVLANGTAFCWGYGFDGQLGDGQATSNDSPTEVASLANVTRIDGGGDQSCAIANGGTVMCWGGNFYGDLGNNGSFVESDTPIAAQIGSVTEISAGLGYHTCAVLSSGGVQCWGEDDYGECGDNNPNAFEDDVPVDVVDTNNAKLANIVHVQLGNVHTCAIDSSNNLWCWGDNSYKELGNNASTGFYAAKANISGVSAVALGGDGFSWAHTCVIIKSTGAVQCWGSNDYGQLGNGSTSTTPIGVANATTPIASGAVAIAAGERHTCAMKNDGTVWCWGYNGSGQIGDNTKTNRSSPVQVTTF